MDYHTQEILLRLLYMVIIFALYPVYYKKVVKPENERAYAERKRKAAEERRRVELANEDINMTNLRIARENS